MSRHRFPKLLLFSLFVIFIVQVIATANYWYWTIRWFDKPMHFAGGAWLAGVTIWWRFFRDGSVGKPRGFRHLVLWGVGTAFIVGAGWEIYESSISLLTVGHINGIIDTTGDLVFDLLGGLAYAIYIYVYARRKPF